MAKKTAAERKQDERDRDQVATDAWKQNLIDDVDIIVEKIDGKTHVTIDVSPETKAILTAVFEAKGMTWDEYWRGALDKFIAQGAKLEMLKAKYDRRKRGK